MSANVETMAYFGKTPWHGLGTELQDVDCTNWQAVLEKSGLNWTAELVPLVTQDSQIVVDRKAVRRTSDGKILGTVGPRYHILQNQDALKWFNPFLESRQAVLHTAGSLAGGSRIWALAKLNRDPMVIATGDEVEKYLLLSHAHDGSLTVQLGFTPKRVVCSNTLAMALSHKASKLIRLRHSKDVKKNLENIRDIIDAVNEEFVATAEQYRQLARRSINQNDLVRYVKRVMGVENEKEISTRCRNQIERILELTETGRGNNLPSVRGTCWAAYNGVAEYLCYEYGHTQSSRLNSLWFGPSAQTNREALEIALAMAS
jgi:phage/plasmid-like protein (TIGR03299 family)